MRMLKPSFYIFFFFIGIISSCDNYQKILKSDDIDLKYNKAMEYYQKKDYYRALPLFEELISVYKGSKSIEEISYNYCYCHYGLGDYLVAAYHFKNFAGTFANSKYAEEALFRHAYCYYLYSPPAKLEQTYTYKAIDAFQLFVNRFPKSEKLSECNSLIDNCRRKLEIKALQNAQLYFDLGQYKAAALAFRNILKDFPDIEEKEQIYFLILQSNFSLASNSIAAKQEERYNTTIESYDDLIEKFPESKYVKEAEKILELAQKSLKIP